MKVTLAMYDASCNTCGRHLVTDLVSEPRGEKFHEVEVLKCLNELCKEFAKPYLPPTVELVPYATKTHIPR